MHPCCSGCQRLGRIRRRIYDRVNAFHDQSHQSLPQQFRCFCFIGCGSEWRRLISLFVCLQPEKGMGKGSDGNMARDAKVFEDITRFFCFQCRMADVSTKAAKWVGTLLCAVKSCAASFRFLRFDFARQCFIEKILQIVHCFSFEKFRRESKGRLSLLLTLANFLVCACYRFLIQSHSLLILDVLFQKGGGQILVCMLREKRPFTSNFHV